MARLQVRHKLRLMDQPAGYLHVGFILISYPNLILIGIMLVVFALALFLPFPGHKARHEREAKR